MASRGGITVKGAPASAEQKRILKRALALADRWNAPYKAKVALVEALIVESEAKNLSTPSADGYGSYGVLQGLERYHRRSDLMDPDYQVGVFLGRGRGGKKTGGKGFTGRGNAISLSKTGMKSGDIAQAIEGSAYPHRYQEVQREAMKIVRLLGGTPSMRGVQAVGGNDGELKSEGVSSAQAGKLAVLQNYLQQQDPNNPLLQIVSQRLGVAQEAQTATAGTTPRRSASPSAPATRGPGRTRRASARAQGLSPLKELFYDPQGGWKGTQPIGPIGGHSDHVHVAAGPKTIVRLGKRAQDMGLNVGENSHFNGGHRVTSGHVANSNHYRDEAIDVSGSPKKMSAFAHYIRRLYGL